MKLIHPEGPWKAPWITAVEGRNGKAMICTRVKGLWFSLIRKTIILCGAGHGLLDLSLSWSNSSKTLWEICSKAVVIILTKPNRVTRRSGWKPGDVLYTLPLLNSTRLFYFPNIWAFCRCCLLPYLLWKNKVEKKPQTPVLHCFYIPSEKELDTVTLMLTHCCLCTYNFLLEKSWKCNSLVWKGKQFQILPLSSTAQTPLCDTWKLEKYFIQKMEQWNHPTCLGSKLPYSWMSCEQNILNTSYMASLYK